MDISLVNRNYVDAIAFIFGLACGSFVNVLALRTLKDESVAFPASYCPSCKHSLAPYDNIPVLSYLLLQGKCRYCRCSISIQYPTVELACGIFFLIIAHKFGVSLETLGMWFFSVTLLAVTVTDVLERLIPHEITYPSLLFGLLYSYCVRHDFLGAMAGVGASYVLFDLLAYYGLKIYLWIHNRDNDEDLEEEIENISVVGSKEAVPVDPSQAKYILTQNVGEKEEPSKEDLSTVAGMPNVELNELVLNSNDLTEAEISEEDIEVMGGGDAVLSAVIAAWLGWQRLFFALVVAFIVGTAIGIGLLAKEMYEAKLLVKAIRPMVLGALAGALIAILIFASFGLVAHLDMDLLPWTPFICLGALGGGLFGFVTVGTRVSKPFPFGPSLACGAVLAIFWDPFGADQSFGA